MTVVCEEIGWDLLPRFCIKLSPRLEVVSHISRDKFTLDIPCFAFQRDCVTVGGQLWTLVSLRGIPCNLLLSDLSMRTTTTNTIMHSQSSGTCPSWSPPSCSLLVLVRSQQAPPYPQHQSSGTCCSSIIFCCLDLMPFDPIRVR